MASDERVKSILEHVSEYFKFKSWSYTQENIDDSIENYFGILIRVTIIGTGDGGEEQKSVFIKLPPTEPVEYLKCYIRHIFEVEAYTYSTLLPMYRSISNVDTRNFMPECYYCNDEKNCEVLVLQDMTCNGYRRYESKTLLDFDHVVVSLKALAKFHSLSIIYKENGYEFDAEVMKPYTDLHPEKYFIFVKNALENHVNLFKDGKYEIYLATLLRNLVSYFKSSTSEASYLIYGHGDFWRENILFKYVNGKPIEACLIDFQKSCKMSPVQDILNFLLGNVESSLRRDNYLDFLNVYLEEIHHNLKENGINNIYSMETLNHDMKVVAPLCIAISLTSYSLLLGLEDGSILKSKFICNSNTRDTTMLKFKNKVIDMLDDLNNFGFIKL